MKYKKIMILAIFLVSLLAISAVSAADNATSDVVSVEETTDDAISVDEADEVVSVEDNQVIEQIDDDGVIGEVDDGTFKALRNKIDNALSGSTLILENDYAFNADTDYELSPWGSYDEITPDIYNKDLTIEGKGHTIDANHLNSILRIGGQSNVVLKNINFKNGYHYDSSNGVSTSAVIGGYDDGIVNEYHVNLSIVGCSFENCYNSQYGGAVTCDVKGYCSLTDCSFLNCSSQRGGAIYKADMISGCIFTDCYAIDYGHGGAIYQAGTVTDCNFTYSFANEDGKEGDAVYECSVVNKCNFINCFDFWGSAVDGADEVVDCNFTHCSGRSGAAISYAKNVKGCSFMDCSSPITEGYASDGGAIHNADNVIDCYFRNCSAEEGGAIYDVANVDGCTFADCSAVDGGAIYNPRKVTNSNFTNNIAEKGGAIYVDYYYNPTITYCNFKDNSKNGQIFFETTLTYYCDSYSKCTLSNLNFEGNGLNYAGGISFANNVLTVMEDKQYLPSDSGDVIDLSKLVYLSGNVSINIAGKTFKTALDSGIAKFDLNTIADGTYDATILYSGCDVAPPLEIKIPLTIKSNIKIQANDLVKYYGGSEKYNVAVTNGNVKLSGVNVNFRANGKTSNAKTDDNGQVSIYLDLPIGTFDVVSAYNGASATSKVTVKSTLATSDVSGTYMNSKVSATFLNVDGKALASKQVTFKAGDKTYTATTNSKGVATADVDLDVGTYTVTAINPVNNEQKQFKLVIDKANSAISLASSQNNGVTTLTATLTPAAATGNVVFNVNGEDKSAAIKNGKATLTLSNLEPGDYAVTASYNGDKNLKASASNAVTFNVAEVYPILTANDLTKTYGTSTKLVVNLVDSKGNAIANADVNVNISSKIVQITTDSSGQATMSINKAPGDYTALITYLDAQTTAKIKVKKATPKLTAKAKTFKKSLKTKKYTVTLKTNTNKVMKNTKVTLKVNGKTYKATTNTKGQATFKITKLTKKGKFTAVVKYAGGKYYNAKTVKAKITVK